MTGGAEEVFPVAITVDAEHIVNHFMGIVALLLGGKTLSRDLKSSFYTVNPLNLTTPKEEARKI